MLCFVFFCYYWKKIVLISAKYLTTITLKNITSWRFPSSPTNSYHIILPSVRVTSLIRLTDLKSIGPDQ